MKSQIRTKAEIKEFLFKAIALVCIVVGSVTTQWWALDGSSWAWYAKWIFHSHCTVVHTGLALVCIMDGSQSLHGGSHRFVLDCCNEVFNGLFTITVLWYTLDVSRLLVRYV